MPRATLACHLVQLPEEPEDSSEEEEEDKAAAARVLVPGLTIEINLDDYLSADELWTPRCNLARVTPHLPSPPLTVGPGGGSLKEARADL